MDQITMQPIALTRGTAAVPRAVPPALAPALPWPVIVPAVAVAAALVGLLAAALPDAPEAARRAGPELTRLLRMMALVKLGIAAGALALIVWRMRQPITTRYAVGYAACAALMAAAPGLIWGIGTVIAGALLFHAGLALLLVLGWRDDAAGLLPPRRAAG